VLNLVDLSGKTFFVAGASSGIGKQTAITLSRLGARLILVARREDKLQETFQSLEGEGHAYYCADLADVDGIEELIKKVISENGKLDGMVYSAGITMNVPFNQLKPEKIKNLFDINFFAYCECVRQITKKGRFNEGMRIVAVSSAASFRGDKAREAYSASKAAMDGATRCLAKELSEKGICINTVAPALTATEMYENYRQESGSNGADEEILKRQYLGLARTEDVANAIAFLISPAARFITGITLPVDGGMTTS